MGVTGLNNIIKKCPSERVKQFSRIVVDGSNLIFTILFRHIGVLRKEHPIEEWHGVDLNIIQQMRTIVDRSISDTVKFLGYIQRKFSSEHIFIVMDPLSTPEYYISSDMKNILGDDNLSNCNHIDYIMNKEECNNKEVIKLNLKENEQLIRKKNANKDDDINNEIQKIDELELEEESLRTVIQDIFFQSFYFNSTSELLRLSELLLLGVEKHFQDEDEQYKVYIIHAKSEADLLIKNLALGTYNVEGIDKNDEIYKMDEDCKTLVLSKDTDYFILFSDSPNVYVSNVSGTDNIYCPYRCFRFFLGDAYSYDAVVRLSPLIGNDYTSHEGIINTTDITDIQDIFNIDGNRKRLLANKRKKICKILQNFKASNDEEDITDLNDIDNMVRKHDESYFRLYLLSIIIYKNWGIYNNCMVRRTENIEERFNNVLEKQFNRILGQFRKIYKWNSEKAFVDWNKFVKSAEDLELNDVETMRKFYNECIPKDDYEDMSDYL